MNTAHPAPPNRYVGAAVARPGARRLLEGRATYVDDLRLPGLCHVVFLRSPYAHCAIRSIDVAAALSQPGVIAAFTGADMAPVCQPWRGTLTHMEGMVSGLQHALAVDVARWQGEALVAVVAETRAQAEDALQHVAFDLEELPPIATTADALRLPPVAPELSSNVCFERRMEQGDVAQALAQAAVVVEQRLRFGRQTGLPMESRSILADYSAADHQFTIHHSHQAPHMVRSIVARQFGMPEHAVRVLCHDVGGSFGLKVHIYPDEMATVAIARLLGRPVKFIADRLESFASDIHAREHEITARMAFDAEGTITALDIEDTVPIGAYSMYPRSSVVEGGQVVMFAGGPYQYRNHRAWLRVLFQNKVPTSQYRAVGHPVACAVAESLVDEGARRLGMDPVALRRRNLIADDAYPCTSPTGTRFEGLSHQACLDRMLQRCGYDALREQQAAMRREGRYLGIGLAMMIELTNPGPTAYTMGGAPISSQDGATLRLEPSGAVTVLVSVGEQGQGSDTVMAQVAADAVGVDMAAVRVVSGDTQATPMGGGTWGSRGAGIGGEAVWLAGRALREQVLAVAAHMLQTPQARLDIVHGDVTAPDGRRLSLEALAQEAYFRPDRLPTHPELVATRHYAQKEYPFVFTNGVQVALVEVDADTGFVSLLRHWVVEDCGTVLNPMLADEQIRGGVVQGIGTALYEECLYDGQAQLLNATLADYLVPMASEMPDIDVAHVCTPTRTSTLGAKGVGEAGLCGAPAAILNAVNDALSALDAQVLTLPITPERVLRALGRLG